MNSYLLKKLSPLSLSILLILSVGILYGFTRPEKGNNNSELLSIVIDYSEKVQCIHITEGTSDFKKIAVIASDNNKELIPRRLKKRGYEVVYKKLSDKFDHQYIFQLINEYSAKGWKIKNHDFGVGTSDEDDSRMSFYLFTK